jgi:hypothetical protein
MKSSVNAADDNLIRTIQIDDAALHRRCISMPPMPRDEKSEGCRLSHAFRATVHMRQNPQMFEAASVKQANVIDVAVIRIRSGFIHDCS